VTPTGLFDGWRHINRSGPEIVFGRSDSDVPNVTRGDGLTFLDVVWDQAPFSDDAAFVAAVRDTANAFVTAGLLTSAQASAIVAAANAAGF
jgi:hypothetical protein